MYMQCVVGIKALESLCYLLMHINPTLNKDYLLTYFSINSHKNAHLEIIIGMFSVYNFKKIHNKQIVGKKCAQFQFSLYSQYKTSFFTRVCCGRDPMVVGFETIYAISAYHH